MNVMGNTITGAASGEIAENAAPKGSQSQANGQKKIRTKLCAFFLFAEIGEVQSFFHVIKETSDFLFLAFTMIRSNFFK